jgi:Uncharacterized protein conserved in bacteria
MQKVMENPEAQEEFKNNLLELTYLDADASKALIEKTKDIFAEHISKIQQ